jgi:hypothetical protein
LIDAQGGDLRSLIESLLDYIEEIKLGVSLDHDSAQGSRKTVAALLHDWDRKDKHKILAEDGYMEATKTHSGPEWTHFVGLGEATHIPSYLRQRGKVQNMFFTRRDTGRLIRQIMSAAKERLQDQGKTGAILAIDKRQDVKPFHEFFECYLMDKFKSHPKVVEVSYNLIEAAKRFLGESDCRLFLAILNKDLHEDTWYDMEETMNAFASQLLIKESKSATIVEKSRRLTFDDMLRYMKKYFPFKGEPSLDRLRRSLLLENKSARTINNLKSLFIHDENGRRGGFLEQLRTQYIQEIQQYTEKMIEGIQKCKPTSAAAADAKTTDKSTLLGRLRQSISSLDPEKTRAEVNIYLARGVKKPLENTLILEAKRTPINLDKFVMNLKMGLLKKSTPPEAISL